MADCEKVAPTEARPRFRKTRKSACQSPAKSDGVSTIDGEKNPKRPAHEEARRGDLRPAERLERGEGANSDDMSTIAPRRSILRKHAIVALDSQDQCSAAARRPTYTSNCWWETRIGSRSAAISLGAPSRARKEGSRIPWVRCRARDPMCKLTICEKVRM